MVLDVLRGRRAADQKRILDVMGREPSLLSLSKEQLRQIAPLFCGRLERHDLPLASHPRVTIMVRILAKPGISVQDLSADLRLSDHTVFHHLRTLQRHGLARVVLLDHRRCVYPSSGEIPCPPPVQTSVSRRILDYLRVRRKGATWEDIHRALADVVPRALNRALRRLLIGQRIERAQQDRFEIKL